MRLDFTGRQTDVTPPLRLYTQRSLRKLSRLLGDRLSAHVVLAAEKHRRVAEVTVSFRLETLVGIEEARDFQSAIHGALGKIEKQAVRRLERRRERKRRARQARAAA